MPVRRLLNNSGLPKMKVKKKMVLTRPAGNVDSPHEGRGRVFLLSRRLLNPYGEIGSGYPSMSMIVISLLLPILRQSWRCLLYDVYSLLVGCYISGSKYLVYIPVSEQKIH